MIWTDFMAARQFLAEERVGGRVRAAARAEDEIAQRSVAALRREEHGPRRAR